MTEQDNLETLIQELELNHEYCPKEIILQAAAELRRLSAKREWQEITQGEIMQVFREIKACDFKEIVIPYAFAIEAKIKEKNR